MSVTRSKAAAGLVAARPAGSAVLAANPRPGGRDRDNAGRQRSRLLGHQNKVFVGGRRRRYERRDGYASGLRARTIAECMPSTTS